ncbi:sia-alpha-2,3-Gal-beta-1,4-GlcNAc-R:alpha 2,8-sialyltransferase isoform X2 [Labrus bergylta]|uniref:ST8 alpha-N-acetyl-neuraminide alpha-2,8-sialyltransferase 3 n=1 Tax=Labrus bergylta TaxID=56723 RepID=A0A3Q3G5L7_9LABR|nr:sia-alpha-2,3-Gal-beta-1,4-GlcNAc-R:alpha 2,8-sialyltransferase-like [Labrus bergylta]XP_060917749.1 sia-alpha-2,3-Gal-beta-1,4-GlcNAc-R:alpha 2,8-sialyltransferase [Labrus mixtus]
MRCTWVLAVSSSWPSSDPLVRGGWFPQRRRMVRIVSALGLVMFSVALLILSLISYVSIKKDFLLSTPRYGPNGGSRLSMFHAGFRSQLAMKYLDPGFSPLTNSLSEDLQNSSKWSYNSTAFIKLKKEIAQYIDIPHNFTLTKKSVRIGQLMHYDYSSHKYVFSIGENFRSLLPEVSPILNKHYNVCAVIGNSGILTGSRCGPQIEKFDYVFRCNFAPTEVFKKDVGRQTNMTTFNPSILEKYYNNLLTVQDRNNFFLSLKRLDGAILWIPAFFFHTSATVTRTLVDFFVEHRGQLKVQLAWPGNIMQYINSYWKTKQLSPKRLSTGILMYTLASSMCNQIHLYGFWPFGWDPNTGKELPYHYYDKKGTKFTTKWQESHQLPAEFKLLYKMHTEGLLKLSLSHCA